MADGMADPHLVTPSGRQRARALGIPFDGVPGALNAVTDVAGVEVGYCTLIEGEGPLVVGKGPVRTGVTAILPRGRAGAGDACFAGTFSMNGNGEMTGWAWIEETGRCDGPVTITNTHSVGLARDATIRWLVERRASPQDGPWWGLPVAAETYDGHLNDINGFHVRETHVFEALDGAAGGAIEEGSVGGGTGMMAYEFKGGSGTASRRTRCAGADVTVGCFLEVNFGRRAQFTVAGVPVGRHIPEGTFLSQEAGSVIGVTVTDAPLLPHPLKRLARRMALGIGRSGSIAGHHSGDLFIAISTANGAAVAGTGHVQQAAFLPDADLDPLFEAVIQATDEAVLNAMVANETMTGRDGHVMLALPHDRLVDLLRQYGRLT
jgi:D-aminopeptidase